MNCKSLKSLYPAKYVIFPDSNLYFTWNIFIGLILLAAVIEIPIILAYNDINFNGIQNINFTNVWYMIYILINIFFATDIVLTFFFAYYNKEHELIY